MIDPRIVLRSVLAQRLTPKERETLAAELRQIAEEQEYIAAAQRREQRRPAAQRVAGAGKGGRPGSMYCYLEQRDQLDRAEPVLSLRIGRGVYDALQALRHDPAASLRLAVQLAGDRLILSEDHGGYAVTVNAGGVRVNVSGARDHLARLPLRTRWLAEAHAGRIVAHIS